MEGDMIMLDEGEEKNIEEDKQEKLAAIHRMESMRT
jgi:hypothetical protein